MFLLNILKAFELPKLFIGWIWEYISSPSYSIALNGELVGFFMGRKGLRQGYPISPPLFALAMDILSKHLDKAVSMDCFKPHSLCSNPLITHLSFVDDVLIFFDGSEHSLAGLLDVLEYFYKASGLKLNLEKSCLFLDGNNLAQSKDLALKFGLLQGSFHVRYLRVPLMPHKLLPQDYRPLIDKVLSRVSS